MFGHKQTHSPAANEDEGADEAFLKELEMRSASPRAEEDEGESSDSFLFAPKSFTKQPEYSAQEAQDLSPSHRDMGSSQMENEDFLQFLVKDDEDISVQGDHKKSPAIQTPLAPALDSFPPASSVSAVGAKLYPSQLASSTSSLATANPIRGH